MQVQTVIYLTEIDFLEEKKTEYFTAYLHTLIMHLKSFYFKY